MVVTRTKKHKKMRGRSTHGWGSRKKHRGAGNRGGRGMAGSGKRADQKKTWILKEFGTSYFGKHGFKVPQQVRRQKKGSILNIQDLPGKDSVNLTEMGVRKLLAKGTPQRKYIITVEQCTAKAREKIEKAGGKIVTE